MFPEYRDLISRLKHKDHHFTRLFDEHNALDQEIKNLESTSPGVNHFELENKKKQKLALKDELYQILKKASAES
ncbi:MAG: hypothetical protein RLY30_876 [Pseudomonadota bacterium]|jgi:uncharacterized protein YdcH (DUF465 family)